MTLQREESETVVSYHAARIIPGLLISAISSGVFLAIAGKQSGVPEWKLVFGVVASLVFGLFAAYRFPG